MLKKSHIRLYINLMYVANSKCNYICINYFKLFKIFSEKTLKTFQQYYPLALESI